MIIQNRASAWTCPQNCYSHKEKHLLLYFKWNKVKVLAPQSCPILCDHMDCSPLGSSVRRILQARILEWATVAISRRSLQPMDWSQVSCIAGRFFTIWAIKHSINCHIQGRQLQFSSSKMYMFKVDHCKRGYCDLRTALIPYQTPLLFWNQAKLFISKIRAHNKLTGGTPFCFNVLVDSLSEPVFFSKHINLS